MNENASHHTPNPWLSPLFSSVHFFFVCLLHATTTTTTMEKKTGEIMFTSIGERFCVWNFGEDATKNFRTKLYQHNSTGAFPLDRLFGSFLLIAFGAFCVLVAFIRLWRQQSRNSSCCCYSHSFDVVFFFGVWKIHQRLFSLMKSEKRQDSKKKRKIFIEVFYLFWV